MIRRVAATVLALWLGVPGTAASNDDTLRVSAVSVEITPPVGVPLAGYAARRLSIGRVFTNHRYATFFEPSIGVLDPITARILYLRKGERRLLFIAADLIGSDRRMRAALIRRLAPLGFGEHDVFLSASHTHSGPGAFAANWVWERAAADLYVDAIYQELVTKIANGVRYANLWLEPATLYGYTFKAEDIQVNRSDRPGLFDPWANVLLAQRADGSWIGGLANLAVHGTALTKENLHYSADVIGSMSGAFETALQGAAPRRPVVLFINGAEGDVAPKENGVYGMQAIGARFATQAIAALPSRTAVPADWSVLHASVPLGRAHFNLRACEPDRAWLRVLASLPNFFIQTGFPRRTDIWAVKLGPHLMLTWPGEPITSLGLELKALGGEAGFGQTWVFGLTNDHLSYFVDPAEYRDTARHSYEACSSLYGPLGGQKIVRAFRTLLGL
jgi:hypothetical protein